MLYSMYAVIFLVYNYKTTVHNERPCLDFYYIDLSEMLQDMFLKEI